MPETHLENGIMEHVPGFLSLLFIKRVKQPHFVVFTTAANIYINTWSIYLMTSTMIMCVLYVYYLFFLQQPAWAGGGGLLFLILYCNILDL